MWPVNHTSKMCNSSPLLSVYGGRYTGWAGLLAEHCCEGPIVHPCRVLRWGQKVGLPGREVLEALCAALEPLKTAERQPWKVQNASLRQGQIETPLGLQDAGEVYMGS